MVEAEGRDGRDAGVAEEVGGVVFAAGVGFDDGEVDALAEEDVEGEEEEELEVPRGALSGGRGGWRGGWLRELGVDFGQVPGEFIGLQGLRVDADPFLRDEEMGRGVQAGFARVPGASAVGAQDGFDEGAGAAFALGAGDVDDVEGGEVVLL